MEELQHDKSQQMAFRTWLLEYRKLLKEFKLERSLGLLRIFFDTHSLILAHQLEVEELPKL